MDADRIALENAFCIATYRLIAVNGRIPVCQEQAIFSNYMGVAKRLTTDELRHHINMLRYLRTKAQANP